MKAKRQVLYHETARTPPSPEYADAPSPQQVYVRLEKWSTKYSKHVLLVIVEKVVFDGETVYENKTLLPFKYTDARAIRVAIHRYDNHVAGHPWFFDDGKPRPNAHDAEQAVYEILGASGMLYPQCADCAICTRDQGQGCPAEDLFLE